MDSIINLFQDIPDIKNESIQAFIDFRKENLHNIAKQREMLVDIFPTIKSIIDMLMGEVYEVGIENDLLKQELEENRIV